MRKRITQEPTPAAETVRYKKPYRVQRLGRAHQNEQCDDLSSHQGRDFAPGVLRERPFHRRRPRGFR